MEWFIQQWSTFADWAAAQHVLIQIVVGSLVLLLAYLLFVLVLSGLVSWVRHPLPAAKDYSHRAAVGVPKERPGQRFSPRQHSRSSA